MIRNHGPRIDRQVRRFSVLRGEVEDIRQEVFIKVFCNLHTVRVDSGNLGGWISRLARNLIIDRLRRGGPLSNCVGSEKLERLALSDERKPNPESAAIRRETSARLREKMQSLSRELAEVLMLRYVREMDYNEIAELLQVPSGTVKSRLKRGRDMLACRSGRPAARTCSLGD
jgi:RNA polymerase sigma-70 factor (ECF subfamily)